MSLVKDAIPKPGANTSPESRWGIRPELFSERIVGQSPRLIACGICGEHRGWELTSAGIFRWCKLTSWHISEDDIYNAGEWTDREVVVDCKLATSRVPMELSAFNRELLTWSSVVHAGAHL